MLPENAHMCKGAIQLLQQHAGRAYSRALHSDNGANIL